MRELKLKIFDISISCSCDEAIYDRLSKDFHFFIVESDSIDVNLKFSFELRQPPWKKLQGLKCVKQSFNSMTYKKENILLNDYYGVALSILDLNQQIAEVYSENRERLYEIAYLLILSRSGKFMDRLGFHKLHGFGVSHDGMAYVGMMPSKGGKTTLFLDLIKNNKEFGIISDDTPVFDMFGKVYSFPLRVGVEAAEDLPPELLKDSYQIDRAQWGKKTLLPLTSFPNKITEPTSNITLLTFVRVYDKSCSIEKCSFLEMFINLQTHMVVGIGLPMILEYFLELNMKDFFRLATIFCKRIISAFTLCLFSQRYKVYLGNDTEINFKIIDSFIKNKEKG